MQHKAVTDRDVLEQLQCLDDATEEGKGDGELCTCPPKAVEPLVTSERALKAATAESGQVKAEVNVVGAEGTQLVLGGVEGAA